MFIENDPATQVDTLTVTDPDSATLDRVTAQITSNYQFGSDFLSGPTAGPITAVFNPATGTLTLEPTGSPSLSEWESALNEVKFLNTSDAPTDGDRVITWIAFDGSNASTPATSTVDVDPVNDPPMLTEGAASTTFTEEGPAVAVDPGIDVFDSDSASLTGATIAIVSPETGDTLEWTDPNLLDGLVRDACCTLTTLVLTGSASPGAYEDALRAVKFSNARSDLEDSTRTVSFVVRDASTDSNALLRSIAVAASNSAPDVNASGGATSWTEPTSGLAAPVTVDPGIDVDDPDSTELSSATVTISNNAQTGDELLWTDPDGAPGPTVTGQGTTTLSFTGAATPAQYETALRAVQFNHASDNPSAAPRTVTFSVTDSDSASDSNTKTVTVTPVNDTPQLEPAGGGTASYTEGGSPTEVAPTITVADADDTGLPSGTVTIIGFTAGDGDVLSLTPSGSHGDITGSFSAGALTLTSASGNATKLQWQNALQDVTYSNTSDNPPASRTVRFQVSDGDAASNQVDYTVSITAV